ncbi:MAG: permease [Spirochaetales bacterium]|nr:permease [Spirochaetales bacterium]MCF7939563.1 permease [Spirochaetales bacterium]
MSEGKGTATRGTSALKQFWGEKKNRVLTALTGVFLAVYFIPFGNERVSAALQESFLMLGEYAREHVLLCLVPAFFIAGAVMVFLNQQAVIRYLGPKAPKPLAYGVASVSGTILAVCSCTVLPLFKGIYRKGAGIGPAVAFLYSGPAINVLAIVLTAKVLGLQLGLARAVGAILFSILIGLTMHLIFRKEDAARVTNEAMFSYDGDEEEPRSLGVNGIYMLSMIGILVFLNWAPASGSMAVWDAIYRMKYVITAAFTVLLLFMLIRWFKRSELKEWVGATRDFTVQILPLLFGGVLVAGFLLGRPGHMAIIPESWIAALVGGNSLGANAAAAVVGALMYFATLTEVPIMQGLIGAGMGNGPALALLLAGPSLSLPNLLVIGGELGAKKTLTYAGLVVVFSTFVGMLYGNVVL